jgi:hypothetical protein
VVRAGQFAALLATFLFLPLGCSDGGSTTKTSTSSGQGGSGAQGGAGGEGGTGGGTGGQGGSGAMSNFGPSATSFVNAGEVSKSPGYKLVWTLGQSTQNQSKMSSTNYRVQGGLVGANGSIP